MALIADASRRSAAILSSLALHAALLALARGHAIELTLEPAPIVLLLSPGARTAGPGEHAPTLHSAAPPPATVTRPSAPDAASSPAVPTPPVAPAAPPVTPPPAASVDKPQATEPDANAPAVKTKPIVRAPADAKREAAAKPAAEKSATARASTVPAPAAQASATNSDAAPAAKTGGDGIEVASTGNGSEAASSAPAWAPAARVRYEELLFAWIDRHKEYPLLAQRRGMEGAGSVRIRIDRDGRVLERTLVRSTGQPMLDQAALDMVRRASPFPAVPREYAGTSFEFVAPVEYRLR